MNTNQKLKPETRTFYNFILLLICLFIFYTPFKRKKPEDLKPISYKPSDLKTLVFYDRADKSNNPTKLSITQIKAFKGCENLTDKEASEKIDGLYKLSLITFNIFKHGA